MKILSFGEIIWDIYSPTERTLGGAPLNFAAYTAMQGCDAYLASAVGSDELGGLALDELVSLGVRSDFISTVDGKPTGQCLVTLDSNGVPHYNVLENVAYDHIEFSSLGAPFDAICFGTLVLRGEDNKKTVEQILSKNSFSEVFTDLNIRPPFYSKDSIDFCLSRSTIVKISDEELPLVMRSAFGKDADIAESLQLISERYPQIKLILITCGEHGAMCYSTDDGETYSCPAAPASVVSTVGAGDSFGATFLVQFMRTRDIPYSLQAAAKVSAFVVSNKESIPSGAANFIKSLV